jgi:hypothetical protein
MKGMEQPPLFQNTEKEIPVGTKRKVLRKKKLQEFWVDHEDDTLPGGRLPR